ncbi:tubulin-specific chaperone e like protein, partial [Zymoseptoria brevis]
MSEPSYHIGQRLSLKGQLCTIRYIGPVSDKAGEWVGVEWDDTSRGKHNGTHQEVRYFECRSSSQTAGSFLRPNPPWDASRTFLQALREKYMPDEAGTGGDVVYFSGKQAEEIGFEKFSKRQAQLQGIHVLVLDHMRIRSHDLDRESEGIEEICAHITDLDLGSNLFETLDEILDIAKLLPKLRNLTVDGNRIHTGPEHGTTLLNVKSLRLSNTLLDWDKICAVSSRFPNLITLTAASNELQVISDKTLPSHLQNLDLSANKFTTLSSLAPLGFLPNLRTLSLKGNLITTTTTTTTTNLIPPLSPTLQTLDLSHNVISTWPPINGLPSLYPSLLHLRTSSNPLYSHLTTPSGLSLTPKDGYMLTIARLPALQTLNYSAITAQERLNAETYYLGQIAAQLGLGLEGVEAVKAEHPRWAALIEEYGEPVIPSSSLTGGAKSEEEKGDPHSLAAQLLTLAFYLASPSTFPHLPPGVERSWTERIPKSFSIYSLLARVGAKLGVLLPIELRLVWETGEWDPGQRGPGQGEVVEWDSGDEEEEEEAEGKTEGVVRREVELVAG